VTIPSCSDGCRIDRATLSLPHARCGGASTHPLPPTPCALLGARDRCAELGVLRRPLRTSVYHIGSMNFEYGGRGLLEAVLPCVVWIADCARQDGLRCSRRAVWPFV